MGEDLYSVLELEKGCDANQIRKQYLNLSRLNHPDKGGDPEVFKKINTAYEVLSDERSRAIYDQTGRVPGEEGPPPFSSGGMPFGMGGGGPFPGFPFDIGSMFGMFGEGGPGPRRGGGERMRGKAPPKKSTIALSLYDMYHGKNVEIHLQQQRFCPDCRGEGSKQSSACERCHGQGHVQQVVQVGPMIMQSTVPCQPCGGKGKQMGPACGLCKGGKFVKRDKTLQVVIPKGAKAGDTIVLEGESSHVEQWTEPGDVVVELAAAEEDHVWVRKGDDLTIPLMISLKDSLCGGSYTLEDHPGYPDGFKVDIPIGIQSGETLKISGAGMPIQGRGDTKGDCIITITIGISESERDVLTRNTDVLRGMFQ